MLSLMGCCNHSIQPQVSWCFCWVRPQDQLPCLTCKWYRDFIVVLECKANKSLVGMRYKRRMVLHVSPHLLAYTQRQPLYHQSLRDDCRTVHLSCQKTSAYGVRCFRSRRLNAAVECSPLVMSGWCNTRIHYRLCFGLISYKQRALKYRLLIYCSIAKLEGTKVATALWARHLRRDLTQYGHHQ
jgi:hypothetical protein